MANPYVKQSYTDGVTSQGAARFNVIEQGIFDAHYKAAVRVTHNAAQSITTATATALAFNTERFDTESNAASTQHDTVTNNSRLTCRTAGIYQITAHIFWASNVTGFREVSLKLNNTTTIAITDDAPITSWGGQVVTTLYSLAVNDFVEVVVFQNSGAGLNVNSSANYSPEFMWVRVA